MHAPDAGEVRGDSDQATGREDGVSDVGNRHRPRAPINPQTPPHRSCPMTTVLPGRSPAIRMMATAARTTRPWPSRNKNLSPHPDMKTKSPLANRRSSPLSPHPDAEPPNSAPDGRAGNGEPVPAATDAPPQPADTEAEQEPEGTAFEDMAARLDEYDPFRQQKPCSGRSLRPLKAPPRRTGRSSKYRCASGHQNPPHRRSRRSRPANRHRTDPHQAA